MTVSTKDRICVSGQQALSDGLALRFPDNGTSADLDQNRSRCEGLASSAVTREALGKPLAIEEVAELLGCSAWTVRQRYLRQGLPYLQARSRGKLVFFREQVIAWIEKRQRQKGGIVR
jgi:Helix-turn-helix domain